MNAKERKTYAAIRARKEREERLQRIKDAHAARERQKAGLTLAGPSATDSRRPSDATT